MSGAVGQLSRKLRLYASEKKKGSFFYAATAAGLGAMAVLALTGQYELSSLIGGGLAGAAVALLAVFALTLGAEAHCAFCGLPRAQVTALICGPAVSICTDCVPLVMAIVQERADQEGQQAAWLYELIKVLPRETSHDAAAPLAGAMLNFDPDVSRVRKIAEKALRADDDQAAVAYYDRIPESERTDADWVNLGVSLSELQRYDEAIEATSRVIHVELRPTVQNNLAWFRVRQNPQAPAEELTRWLRDVREAQQPVSDLPPTERESALCNFLGTEAEILRALGADHDAMEVLNRIESLAPLSSEQLLIRARLRLKFGDKTGARLDAERARATVRTGSALAKEAQAFLERFNFDFEA